jgi:RimJ/RimL family protein N-acetyltransferase
MVAMIPEGGRPFGDGPVASLAWPSTAPILTDGEITLREWTSADADVVLAACQDADLQRWMDIPVPYLREHAVDFVGPESRAQWSSHTGAPFAITATDSDQVLGSCGLVGVSSEHLVAEVVCGVAPWARGRNVATRAVRLLCDWAFSDVGLARLEFYIEPANVASRALASRLDCQFEGTLRSKALMHGTRRDMALYALLR